MNQGHCRGSNFVPYLTRSLFKKLEMDSLSLKNSRNKNSSAVGPPCRTPPKSKTKSNKKAGSKATSKTAKKVKDATVSSRTMKKKSAGNRHSGLQAPGSIQRQSARLQQKRSTEKRNVKRNDRAASLDSSSSSDRDQVKIHGTGYVSTNQLVPFPSAVAPGGQGPMFGNLGSVVPFHSSSTTWMCCFGHPGRQWVVLQPQCLPQAISPLGHDMGSADKQRMANGHACTSVFMCADGHPCFPLFNSNINPQLVLAPQHLIPSVLAPTPQQIYPGSSGGNANVQINSDGHGHGNAQNEIGIDPLKYQHIFRIVERAKKTGHMSEKICDAGVMKIEDFLQEISKLMRYEGIPMLSDMEWKSVLNKLQAGGLIHIHAGLSGNGFLSLV